MAAAPASTVSERPTVLAVDDQTDNRDLLRRVLEKDGVEVVTASNGAGAIAAYCRNNPRVVLLDLSMPGVDGFMFLEWLQQEPEETRAPTIVLTASSDRDSVRRAAGLGISGYVVKPFDADDLRQRVRDLLASAPPAQFI